MLGFRRRTLALGAVVALLAGCSADQIPGPTVVELAPAGLESHDGTMLPDGPALRASGADESTPTVLSVSAVAAITSVPTFVFGDYPNRTTAASILSALGYPVATAITLPADLTPYKAIWHVGAFVALTPAEITRLQAFLAAGGGLHLTGERPCCETMNASLQTLINSVVVGGGVTVGGLGDPFGPHSFNALALGGLTSTPNVLTVWNASGPGGMAGVTGAHVLAKAVGGTPVGAVWNGTDLVGGSGRLTILMDVNWFANSGASGVMLNIQEFLANATGGDATPPAITADVAGTLGDNGWYRSDVDVSWTVVDNESAVTSSTGCGPSSVTTNTAGTTFTCTATSSGGMASESVTIKRDATDPTVSFSGNAGTYTVDQTVSITCSASDDLSGVASTSGCVTTSGPAYTFGLGATTLAAGAIDNAGNAGSASTTFNVAVTPASLCALTRSFVTKTGIATSLCAKLIAAAASEARGASGAMQNQLGAFVHEVEAQTDKAVSSGNAAILIGLANSMM